MANAAGFIHESIWRDPHWRTLARSSQALYMQLLSQKELDCAGILPLQPNKWAKGCDGLTVEQVWDDLEELQRERFVYFDTETDEAFIRTYMRNSNVSRSPNMMKSARRAAVLVGSDVLKPLLAVELRATGQPEAIQVAYQIDPSGTPPEPFPNGSKSTVSEPFAEPSGVGEGVGTGVTLASSSVGKEPSPHCSDHPNGTDRKCFACGQARRDYPELKAKWDADIRSAAANARQAAINGCNLCDEFGEITLDDAVRRCNHQEAM